MNKSSWELIPKKPFGGVRMFCPNSECKNFVQPPGEQNWYYRHGTYPTDLFGRVPRYRCRSCGKCFSKQTFSIDYYARVRVDYKRIVKEIVTGGGLGNMSRFSGLREETIQNRVERLSRVFLAIGAELRREVPFDEDLVLDGFESFSYSQYYPNNVNIVVGSASEMIHGMGLSVLRRKGRMTEAQKKKRQILETKAIADPKDTERSVASLLRDLAESLDSKGISHRRLFTDEHSAYPRSLALAGKAAEIFEHRTISSRKPRTRVNPLFPVNYVDRQFRKDLANHHRETVQYARSPQAMMSRLTVYQFYHNHLGPYRVSLSRRGNFVSRAQVAGIPAETIRAAIAKHWGYRPFFKKTDLWEQEQSTWLQRWRNPGAKQSRRIPKYIAA